MISRRSTLTAGQGLLAATALGAARPAAAQAYPSRTVTMVVPWPPGGPGDVVGRLFAQRMAPRLHQTVVVDNRAGATGAVGLAYAARVPADGYTFALASIDTHALNPHFYERLPYRALEDFTPVGGFSKLPMALCVNADRGWADAEAFVRAAKAPGANLSYSTWGNGSLAHVAMALFAQKARIEMLHVPYVGAAPALNALMAGEVDAMIVPLSMAEASLPGKRIRTLGTSTMQRVSPEMPTLSEQGYLVDIQNWFGIVTGGRPPREVVERVSRELGETVTSGELADAFRSQSMQPFPSDSETFGAFMAEEYQRLGRVMAELEIRQKG